ncbi:hypothetical protein Q8W71_21135 [Methylobacterium sp. NEAU 140]|uniref:hypothetical protein n=1 Tax=Methylobacterium sp. NEAU 140 TaxID=3064945 RepID=UPI0027361159|nr:hypothetical protein [Methylobacterium sp. NEAU 140]MDP4025139.1 hypothetical protein [Methylobacterium sp. NEAU 140]
MPGARLRAALVLLALAAPARADEFVDVLGSKVWARKGGLACGSAAAARAGGGFFSDCLRLPVATRVQLVDTPEMMTQVYEMRIVGTNTARPKTAWFTRESLTNNPKPDEFVPDP